MKDSKFIELLNLYVDQEISPEDSVLLEREITSNPERKKIYLQYCRMHRASVLLCESFRSETAPSGSKLARAARSADDKIARFPDRKASSFAWGWFGVGGLAAAAACAAFVFLRQNPVASGTTASLASTQTAVKTDVIAASVSTSFTPVSSKRVQPVLVARSLEENMRSSSNALASTATASSLEWMNKVQLPPMKGLSIDAQAFDAKNALKQDPGTFHSPQPIQGRVEMTAFQFQR